jgi:hypothetical protein
VLDALDNLEAGSERAQDILVREVNGAHPRSVWAMSRRQGQWRTLSLDLHLSDGAAQVARTWSRDPLTKLTGVLDLLQARSDLKEAHGLIQQLRETTEKARVDFVAQARNTVHATIWSPMHADLRLWANCEAEWRTGPGYRSRVVAHLNQWFRHNEQYAEDFRDRLQTAWRERFIEQLRALCTPADVDAGIEAA